MQHQEYDVVVVGGGAAGLSAGLTLARARRSVLVVDAGQPRNAPADGVHGFLTRDGVPPAELVALGTAEVRSYGGEVVEGTVTGLVADPDDRDRVGFGVRTADGADLRARRVVLATGLVDVLPDVPGVAERWGRDVVHCPYCHGYEVRDRAVGVLATGPLAVHQAQLFRQWTDDVTLFLHTAPPLGEQDLVELAARDIDLVEGRVEELVVVDDVLRGVRLASGAVVPREVVVTGAPMRSRSDLLVALGVPAVELEVQGHVVGDQVPAGPTGETSVRGLYVAGNVADMRAQVVHAAAAGVMAAAAVNADLVLEDVADAVAARRVTARP